MKVSRIALSLTGLFLLASNVFAVELPTLRRLDKIKDRTAKFKLESSSDVVNVNCTERSTNYTFTSWHNSFEGGSACHYQLRVIDADTCSLSIAFALAHDGTFSSLNVNDGNTECYNTSCEAERLDCETDGGRNNNGLVTVFPAYNLKIAPKREDRVKFYHGNNVWEVDIDER